MENFKDEFKSVMLVPTQPKLIWLFSLPLIKILWIEIFSKSDTFTNWTETMSKNEYKYDKIKKYFVAV